MSKKRRWTKKELWELQEMYSNPEYSVREMAKHFGVSEMSIRNMAGKNFMQRGKYKDIGLKKCWKCKEVFPSTTKYFHKSKTKKDGLNQCCKECNKEISRKWRKRRCSEDK